MADSKLSRILTAVLWLILAVALFAVWTTLGGVIVFLLPAQLSVPRWVAYGLFAAMVTAWPFLLLVLTRRFKGLNKMLFWVYGVWAATYLASAVAILVGSSDFTVNPPIWEYRGFTSTGTTANAMLNLAIAAGIAGSLVVAGWSNKRINPAA